MSFASNWYVINWLFVNSAALAGSSSSFGIEKEQKIGKGKHNKAYQNIISNVIFGEQIWTLEQADVQGIRVHRVKPCHAI